MTARASGEFRRTPVERSDQRVAWQRSDQAFFAAGACHILAWTCRSSFPDQPLTPVGIRFPGEPHVFHVYTTWHDWAFDHAGWHLESDLLDVNRAFEGRDLERVHLDHELADFCEHHNSRMPRHYWDDPVPRARSYVARFAAPWT